MSDDIAPEAAAVALAYRRLFSDSPQRGDSMTVLVDMARRSGFYDVPSITAWMRQTGSPAGFEAYLHELSGRRAVFADVSSRAALSEADSLRLETIARFRRAPED